MERKKTDDSEGHTVSYDIVPDGFVVGVDSDTFRVGYPKEVWSKTPLALKKVMIENYIVLATYSMPLMSGKKTVNYEFGSPLLESFFLMPSLNYIPSAENNKEDNLSLITKLLNIRRNYKETPENLRYNISPGERVICFMTFGKDSLLTYALCKDIGLNPVLVYIEEPDVSYKQGEGMLAEEMHENTHKRELIKMFSEEFKIKISVITNSFGEIRYPDYFGSDKGDFGWAANLTEYSFLSLPFNYAYDSGMIAYGNEASCSIPSEEEGTLSYPVFEQSKYWTMETSKMLKIITGSVNATSLIEPIHDLAIMKILHKRYPQYAKYQMSCFADSNHAKTNRWCQHCSKCARIYVFLKAINIDPAVVGFSEDMFSKQKEGLYSLFGTDPSGCSVKAYDSFGIGRDEMLLAFYLAYKNGAKGDLIDKFKKEHLAEAISREKELSETFFGIHTFDTIPEELRGRLREIFESELKKP